VFPFNSLYSYKSDTGQQFLVRMYICMFVYTSSLKSIIVSNCNCYYFTIVATVIYHHRLPSVFSFNSLYSYKSDTGQQFLVYMCVYIFTCLYVCIFVCCIFVFLFVCVYLYITVMSLCQLLC
jgi:hypothetical protein